MQAEKIRCNEFEMVNLLEHTACKCVGQHSTFSVVGVITEATKNNLQRGVNNDYHFYAVDHSGTEELLFTGNATRIAIKTVNNAHILSMECVSKTALTDRTRYIRTFQDTQKTYKTVVDDMARASGNVSIIVPEHKNVTVSKLLVQYQETDWQFAHRLAGLAGTVVVPDYLLNSPHFSVGVPPRETKNIEILSYTCSKEIGSRMDIAATGNNISPADAICYTVKSREILQLCDRVPFDGNEFLIYSIVSSLENEQLVHTYELKPKGAFCCAKQYNRHLVGASLEGTIIQVKEDLVRVSIHGDIPQKRYKWFVYATPFSVPDGAGWYFMPEEGDTVRLRFPAEIENEAYVASSIHVTHGDRKNPEVKYLRTVYGQELRFSPNSVVLRDGAGSSITLNHKEGIYVDTDKNILVKAGADIRVVAGSTINIEAENQVLMMNNDSIIELDKNIDIVSRHSRIQ